MFRPKVPPGLIKAMLGKGIRLQPSASTVERVYRMFKSMVDRACGDFFEERRAVMKIAWYLTKREGVYFPDAVRVAWAVIRRACR